MLSIPVLLSHNVRSRLVPRLLLQGALVGHRAGPVHPADGSSLLVEVDDQEPGIQRASRVDDFVVQAKLSLDGAMEHIRAMAAVTLTKLHDLPRRPDDIEVEFGVPLPASMS
jgi:hypothetical protein